MPKSKIFFYSCLFFVLGVGIGSYLPLPLFVSFVIFLTGCVTFFLGWPSRKVFIVAGLGGIFLFLGILRFVASEIPHNESHISFYNEQEVTFIGIVNTEPDIRSDHVKLKIKSKKLKIDNDWRVINGNVLINTKLYPEYHYGDELEIACTLRKPEPVNDFAYDKYLAKEDVYSLCYWPEIKFLESGKGNKLISGLLFIKSKFVAIINKIIPEPQAAFLGALLYGAKRGIPEDLMNKFNTTGTTHIIAISGYNITILAALLLKLTKGIGIARKKSFWFSLVGISFFVIITGASASVVRAAIMGGLVLLAGQVGRVSRVSNALLFAAAAMLIFNPKILAFDIGFQLSFAATLGLIFLSPIFEKRVSQWPKIFGIRDSFVTTMAAIIMTLPLILYHFGRVSMIAIPANILILSVIPPTMAIGFIAVLGGLIYIDLGQILGWLAWALLSYIIKVVEILSKIPWAATETSQIHWTILVAAYFVIGGFVWWQNYKLTRINIWIHAKKI